MSDWPIEASVTPIVEFRRDWPARPVSLLGTATVLNNGYYLTARHVIEAALSRDRTNIGIQAWAAPETCFFDPISEFEFAPGKRDLALGKSQFSTRTEFGFDENRIITLWQEVFGLGYPESVVSHLPDKISPQLRAFKGIVQRNIYMDLGAPPKDHSDGIELDFAMGQGASGSPIFSTKNYNRMMLCGIYSGARKHEIVIENITSVDDDGKTEIIKTSKIEYYGEAVMLSSILDWIPSISGGRSLLDILK